MRNKMTKQTTQRRVLTPEQIMARSEEKVYKIINISKYSEHYDNKHNVIGAIIRPIEDVKWHGPRLTGGFKILNYKRLGYPIKYIYIRGISVKRLRPWYFTFGYSQKHKGTYVEIWGTNSNSAREKMIGQFGLKWSMQYTPNVFKSQPTRWNYVPNEVSPIF